MSAPYKIQRRGTQYRTILPHDDLSSPWFPSRVEAVRWAILTIERIDSAKA